jgi:hypothetical protein
VSPAKIRRPAAAIGLKPGAVKRGRIHDWFSFVGPGRHRFTIYSSHAAKYPV